MLENLSPGKVEGTDTNMSARQDCEVSLKSILASSTSLQSI